MKMKLWVLDDPGRGLMQMALPMGAPQEFGPFPPQGWSPGTHTPLSAFRPGCSWLRAWLWAAQSVPVEMAALRGGTLPSSPLVGFSSTSITKGARMLWQV